ncbi:hypothetical protein GRF29_44g950738 [Pseudopithomyces chartarum]|uniref:SCP domain-containing protein n=1 Tax=Pseudopithomyces chartarum TaxID=1892770 RepID=A0AAN6M2G2_9PLEO|nr:hypothetical protein GRF29_44g950738 [Pseudopithomyces chartarum]
MKVLVLITTLAAAVMAVPKSGLIARDAIDSPEIPNSEDKELISTYRAGSNLSGVGPAPKKRADFIEMARTMVHGWHEEEMFYDYGERKSKNDRQVFHFTQLVWRDSSQIGCAVTDCSDHTDTFPARLYCYYDPIGNNVAGNFFAENVWPPVCADPSRSELEARFGF